MHMCMYVCLYVRFEHSKAVRMKITVLCKMMADISEDNAEQINLP